jgi:hypothetical protein
MNILEARKLIADKAQLLEEARSIKSMKDEIEESLKLVKGETKADLAEAKEFIADQNRRYEEIKAELATARTEIRIGLARSLCKAELISEVVAELEIANDAYSKEGLISKDAAVDGISVLSEAAMGTSDHGGGAERTVQIKLTTFARRTFDQMVSYYSSIKEKLEAETGPIVYLKLEDFLMAAQKIVPDIKTSAKDMGKSERLAIRQVIDLGQTKTQRDDQKPHAQAANEERKKYAWNK